MSDSYSCTVVNCNKVFFKAYELKKHTVSHEDPDRVFSCSYCDFITLQKKSLAIHVAIHTGEKIHACPDHTSPAQCCEYRTNDPAALSKHRKKAHGYIPPPNRSRLPRVDPRKDEVVTRYRRRPQRSSSASRRRPSRAPRTINYSNGIAGCTSAPVENQTTILCQDNAGRDVIDVDHYGQPCYDLSSPALARFDDEMRLDTLYDPSLNAQWMAVYEDGYSSFHTTGMKYVPEPLHAACSASVAFDMQTDRKGCLCPEWMVEARIEGWD